MIIFRFVRILKYFLFAGHKRGHGLHSPFVFDLVTRVFRNKIDKNVVSNIKETRERLKLDKRLIKVNDLGSGSLRFKSKIRKVSEIARYSSVPEKYGLLLLNLASEFGKPEIVEMGTSLGISTLYLASGAPDSIVYTIEGCSETSEIAKQTFIMAGLSNIKLINGSFKEILPEIIGKGIKPGLVFIDGDHRKESVIKYFNQLALIAGNNTVIAIDDINESVGMSEAWDEIRHNERVSVTIDLYRMGLAFFREGINHNDYIIRY